MNRKKLIVASLSLCVATGIGGALLLRPDAARADATPTRIAAAPSAAQGPLAELFRNQERYGETRAVLILRDGQPVFEQYRDGFGPDSKLISWSISKSITAVLIGMLVSDGRLALDAPAPVPEWQRPGDPRGAITLRNLLQMASGLKHSETNEEPWTTDTAHLLFGPGAANMASTAESVPLVAKPDTAFNYSSATSVILSDILTRTLTDSTDPDVRRTAVMDFIRGRLMEPVGMPSLTPEFDARGTMVGGSIMHATARDYARFGEFLRNHGVVNGQRHLPESWIQFMLTSSRSDPAYGGHIWLNRGRPKGSDAALWPDKGPNDLFACLGYQGQYIIVSPSQRLTIVRLGISDEEQLKNVRGALQQVTAAY